MVTTVISKCPQPGISASTNISFLTCALKVVKPNWTISLAIESINSGINSKLVPKLMTYNLCMECYDCYGNYACSYVCDKQVAMEYVQILFNNILQCTLADNDLLLTKVKKIYALRLIFSNLQVHSCIVWDNTIVSI